MKQFQKRKSPTRSISFLSLLNEVKKIFIWGQQFHFTLTALFYIWPFQQVKANLKQTRAKLIAGKQQVWFGTICVPLHDATPSE